MQTTTDLFIIGGGINGTAIAADAAGRGLSVTLCEKADLASGTSSASTKLIHGGLRYLELYEFNLVRKALAEREILMHRLPNLVTPLEFVLPYENHLRPAWLIRLGLFFYDYLSLKNHLPKSKSLNLKTDSRGKALQDSFEKGFSYYDCFTDDARLVTLNALSAKENGANILTHTQFISAKRELNYWKIHVKTSHSDLIFYAKALLNVSGPWVAETQKNIVDNKLDFEIELVKGSHIIVPKLYEGNFAYILQNRDKRVVFAIPYQQAFTLIGTTDVLFTDDLNHVNISDDEKTYLCQIANHYFKKTITTNDIVWSYAGTRCLQAATLTNPSEITRDYKILVEDNTLPLLTVIGGKITTHRTLAEDVLHKLKPYFPHMGPDWTAKKPLPGGEFTEKTLDAFYQKIKTQFSWLPDNLASRYAKNYGARTFILLEKCQSLSDLGMEFGPSLYQKEVDYLLQNEWAKTAEDILWRRTKLGLFFSTTQVEQLNSYCFSH